MTIQLFDDLDNLLGTFTSIQAAVDAASSGDTIVLGAGTFREQVTIDGAVDLTIRGAGAATIVEMVDAPAANANGGESVFSVLSSTNVIIEDLTVDARGLGSSNAYYGVYYRNSSGEIDNLTVTGVRAPLQNDGTPQGGQIGRAIFAENVDAAPRMLAVTNNTVTDFQKNGIDLRGVGLDVLVDGNVVEGSGFLPAANAIAQNGIVLVNGPTGTISNNEVSEIGFARGDFSTAGILGFNAGDGVVVDNNTILGPRDGQDVLVRSNIGGINFTAGEADSLVITNNTLDGVLNGIILGDNVDTPTVTGNVFLNPVLSLVTNTGQGTLDGANFVVDGDDNDAALNLTGTDGRDEIEGTDFADTLNGGEGGDELDGGDGDDVLDGGAGSDSITGGAGTDVAIIADNEGAPFVDTDFDFSGLTVAGGSVSGTLTGPDGDKTLDGVEVIRVSNTGSSTFVVLDGMSIQDAVNSASAGDTIQIEAGTFTESVTVDKALNFVGAGADQTIIDPASGSGFDLVGDLGTDATVSIDGIGFTDGVAGVDFDDNAILGTLTITNSDFTANTFNGVRIGGNSNPVDLDNVVITDTTFTGNGQPQSSSGDGDILFFQYNGDATITNVTIVGQDRGSGPAENGIQFRGDAGSLGDVTLTNVDISGVYEKQPLAIFNYDDITGLTATDVTITADSTGFELALNFAGVGGDFSLAGIDATGAPDGTALQGDASSQAITGGAADDFLLGSLGNDTLDGGDGADAAGYTGSASDFTVGATVDATSGRVLSFTSVTDNNASDGDEGVDTLSNIETLAFNVGTAMVSTLDLADPVQLLDSNGDLIGTFDTIGAAVTAASAGEAIVVAEGTYDEVVTIDKALSVRGANVGTAGDATRSPESVVAKFVVAADDVDIDGFSVDGTLSAADGTGVAVGAFENVTVQNNVFSDLAERGVDAQGDGTDAGLVIDDNAFDDVGATSQFTNYAIFVDGYAGGSISGNEIDGGLGSGLTLFNADAFQIDGNDFDDTGDEAVNLTNVQNSTFTNNEITDAGPGASFNPVSGMVVFGDLTGTTVSGNAFVLTRPADEETALVLGGAGPTVQGVTVADNTYDGFAAGVVVANVDGSVSVQEDIADFANITQDVDGPTAGPAILVFNGFEGLGVVDEAALSASGTFAKTDTFDADGAPGADDGTAFFANAQDARDASKTGAPITVSGSAGNDSQTGSDGADIINGGAGEDVINGGAGDDTLAGGPGADFINGQQGAGDFADYRGSTAAVTVRLDALFGRGGDAEGDVLLGIEGVLGSAFNDFLVGAADPAGLFGFGGDDTLIGLAGDDTLDGGADNDRLEGRGGADDLIGGDGFDIADYRGSGAAVTLRFDGGSGAGGDAQGDTFAALEGAFGSAFNDFIVGEAGVAMNLQGLAGDDSLIGQDLNDTLLGGDGDDRIEGRAGADVLNGGSGFDIVDYRTSAAGVTVRFDTGTGAGGDAQGDRLTGFEAIFGSGFTDLIIGGQGVDSNLQGLGGADTLIGLDGEDALSGGDGNDRLEGRGGADVLRGGDGFDIADYRTSASGVFVRFDAGTGSGGDAQGDLLFDLEGVFGSAFNDFLIGADGVAVNLQGLDGDDRLIGFDGDDTLLGGDGDDRLEGRGGANVIDGGAGDIDIVDYRTSASAVNVRLDAGRGFAGDALGDQYAGIEIAFGSDMADFIVGAAGVNVNLQGFGGDDTLIGLDGDDVLVGGSGDDRLEGRGGGDIYRGGDGFDIVDYRLSNAGVTARLDIERGIGGDAQGDFLFDLEGVFGSNFADLLIGRAGTDVNLQGLGGSDRLIGIDGDDTLSGGDGNDRLEGRAGDDRLSGGAGFDIFEFAPGFGNDVITDFEDTDFIFLTGFGAAFDTFAEVIAAAVEIDGDTVITFGTDATLTLENTTIAQLEADQFLF